MVAERPDSVCAVVVTRNRLALLRECLAAVGAQTLPPDEVLVVDNASTDGTQAAVPSEFPGVELVRLEVNEGGAGGFHEGMRAASERGHGWLWLMDDDTIPAPEALERLLDARERLGELPAPRLLASKVVWTDGSLHPKNLPYPRAEGAAREQLVAGAERGLLAIRAATFVSVLISREAVAAHGLPHKHYFIWGDDGEYTARILKHAAGYLVPDSVAVHKTPRRQSVHAQGSPRYYWELRNKLLMLRSDSWTARDKLSLAASLLAGLRDYASATRLRPAGVALVARALRDGLRHPPDPPPDLPAERARPRPVTGPRT